MDPTHCTITHSNHKFMTKGASEYDYLLGSPTGNLLVEDDFALVQLLAVHGEQERVLGLKVSVYEGPLDQ